MPDFPNLPTFKELNHPEFVDTTWFSFSGPAKLPDDIVEKLNKSVAAAVAMPDVQARFRRDGFIAQQMRPAEFTNFVVAENTKRKVVIEGAGVVAKPQ